MNGKKGETIVLRGQFCCKNLSGEVVRLFWESKHEILVLDVAAVWVNVGVKMRRLQKHHWKTSVWGEAEIKAEPGVKLRSWTPMAEWEWTGAARVQTERFVHRYGRSPFVQEGGAHV